jgi:hypothetical protein
MSNFAALRALVIASHAPAGMAVVEAQALFDKAWELAKGEEARVADMFVGLLHPHPPEPAPVSVPQPSTPLPTAIKPLLNLDPAALAVILDALGSRTMFDDAARAQVLKELLVEMRRAHVAVSVSAPI